MRNNSELIFTSEVNSAAYKGSLNSEGTIEGTLTEADGKISRWRGHAVNNRLLPVPLFD